jgi:hypothetical protein
VSPDVVTFCVVSSKGVSFEVVLFDITILSVDHSRCVSSDVLVSVIPNTVVVAFSVDPSEVAVSSDVVDFSALYELSPERGLAQNDT